jgi:hypothetical protein
MEKKYIEDMPDYEYYLNIKGPISPEKNKNVVIQINSISRIIGIYDIIILDEISYTITTLINFYKKKVKVFETLNELIFSCEKIICMDAGLIKNEINFVKNIRKEKKSYLINNINDKYKGNVYFYEKKNFINCIIKNLENGKKVELASNSESFISDNLKPILEEKKIKYLI